MPCLIKSILPAAWMQKSEVIYNPHTTKGPPGDWFLTLWRYLAKENPNSLADYEELAVLPIKDTIPVHLVVLSLAQPKVIMRNYMGMQLSDSLCSLMKGLGLHPVGSLPRYVRNHPCILGTYVKLPTAEHVTDVLLHVYQRRNGIQMLVSQFQANHRAAEELVALLSTAPRECASPPKMQMLQRLPLFQTVQSTSAKPKFASVSDIAKGVENYKLPIQVPCRLLLIEDETHKQVSKYLGVQIITLSSLIVDFLIPCIHSQSIPVSQVTKLMLYILTNMHILDKAICKHFSQVSCIENVTGNLARPSGLFDPGSQLMQSLFSGVAEVFPAKVYNKPNTIALLLKMGMKKEQDLTAVDVKQAMLGVASTPSEKKSQKGIAILTFLSRYPHLLKTCTSDGRLLLQSASSLSWVPTVKDRPDQYPKSMKWAGPTTLCRTSEVVASRWATLVGASVPVVSSSIQTPEMLEQLLGWNKPPPVRKVVEQLQEVTVKYNSCEKSAYLRIILEIYRHLSSCSQPEVQQLLSGLSRWVWVGNGFACPTNVVLLNSIMKLEPDVQVLPEEMKEFQSFLTRMGVKAEVDYPVLVDVLHSVKQRYSDSDGQRASRTSVRSDLRMVVDILIYLGNHKDNLDDITKQRLLLPVQCTPPNQVLLLPLKDCAYRDREQSRILLCLTDEDGVKLVHETLPIETAQALGVSTLIGHANELEIMPFGQSESLTNRLSHLLEDYTDGLSIVKEMIQNADDAGAKIVKFMYDERTNDDALTTLLDPNMKKCQGPAFWIYNDAIFTDEDFDNLISLGKSTKEEVIDKVGEFGLGFNAVYNMTDVPTIVSQDSIAIFDPHLTYLENALPDKGTPGLKFNFQKKKRILKNCQDQFKPFKGVFGCDLSENSTCYQGTIFRLPLRTARQSKTSRLCGSYYDNGQMWSLLEMLAENSHKLLLFTQHVESLEVYYLPKDGDPKVGIRILSVQKTTIKTVEKLSADRKRAHGASGVLDFVAANRQALMRGGRVSAVVQTKKMTDKPPCMAQHQQLHYKTHEAESLYWLVSIVIGNEEGVLSSHKQLPRIGGLAMPLVKDKGGFVPKPLDHTKDRGQLFCGMPLPVYCDVPVHINATFALHSSRRRLIHSTTDDIHGAKFEWNSTLMEGVITEAYLFALEDTLKIVPAGATVEYYTMWPTKIGGNDQASVEPLLKSFYSKILSADGVPLLYSNGRVVTFHRAVLIDTDLGHDKKMGPVIIAIMQKVLPRFTPVMLPARTFRQFELSGQAALKDKRYDFNRYYQEIVFPNLTGMEEGMLEKHMSFALEKKKAFERMLLQAGTSGCMCILEAIWKAHGHRPLEHPTLLLSVEILKSTGVHWVNEKQEGDLTREIFMPNEQKVLMPSSKLYYSDGISAHPREAKVEIVNELVPLKTARALGVKSRREFILETHSRGIPFGQSEDLTNAIRRVLQTYPSDHEILKEMIQNADDAKATKIHFILDPRYHPCEKIFDKSWKPLQGPALCVYNNGTFTEGDLEGIQKFGKGTKGCDPSKTGQYGLGFNSVYHVTDVPSILTSLDGVSKTLCVFDPQCTFVPGATKEKPGRRYEKLDELREEFPDVFLGYLEDIIDIEKGTMFRLPLRNKTVARRSRLLQGKQRDVGEILDMLCEEASRILLFLNHLQDIEISEITQEGRLKRIHKVQSKVCCHSSELIHVDGQAVMAKMIRQAMDNVALGQWDITDIPKATILTKLEISEGNKTKSQKVEWYVAQCIGLDPDVEIPASVKEAIGNGNLALLPRGGVAAPLTEAHDSFFKGQAFCFLPMPLLTHLPVHVNGHFALGHENRRDLWTNKGKGGYRADWNDFLCQYVIGVAYAKVLEALKALVSDDAQQRVILESQLNKYQSFFPLMTGRQEDWAVLIKACYQHLATLNVTVLPTVIEVPLRDSEHNQRSLGSDRVKVIWHSAQGRNNFKIFFPELPQEDICEDRGYQDRKTRQKRKLTTERQKLDRCLIRCGFGLLHVKDTLTKTFEAVGVPIQRMSPAHVVTFFASHQTLCKKDTLPAGIQDTSLKNENDLVAVLRYCNQDENSFHEKLDKLPLLLTADGQLRQFDSEKPVYSTVSCPQNWLPKCDDIFLHPALRHIFPYSLPNDNTGRVIKEFDIHALSRVLERQLPPDLFCIKSPVQLECRHKKLVTDEWLADLWQFVDSQLSKLFDDEKFEALFRNATHEGKQAMPDPGKEAKRKMAVDLKKSLLEHLEPLQDWCLIPTKRRHLVAVRDAHLVLGQSSIETDKDISRVLRTRLVYFLKEPSSMYRKEEKYKALTSIVTTPDDVVATLNLLHLNRREEAFSIRDAKKLLKYFTENVGALQEDKDNIAKLVDLPVYLTLQNELTALTGYHAYVLPTKIPRCGIDVSRRVTGIVFLQRCDTYRPLFNFLKCEDMEVEYFYCSFLFQCFEYLEECDRMKHLYYLYSKHISNPQKDATELTEKMRNQALIADSSGELWPASHFYDQSNILFATFKSDLSPPKASGRFNDQSWKSFLGRIGLVTKVSPTLFLQFAQKVAACSRICSPGQHVARQSKLLLEELFRQHAQLKDHPSVSRISFVEPASPSPELSALCPVQQAAPGYIQLSGAIPQKHEKLVWTQVRLLPTWANPEYTLRHKEAQDMTNVLGIRERPEASTILNHLRTLSEYLQRSSSNDTDREALELRKQVFKKIYRHLVDFLDESDRAQLVTMETAKCVLVDNGRRVIAPCQVAENLSEIEQIRPYLYGVPAGFGDFRDLFLKMGGAENATTAQYVRVLECLYKAQEEDPDPDPNQIQRACNAARGLFSTILKGKDSFPTCTLYLPSRKGALLASTDLVHDDVPSYFSRTGDFSATLLVDVVECGVEPRLAKGVIEKIPRQYRPKLLSNIVEEVLVESALKTVGQSEASRKLNERIRCETFGEAVKQLLLHAGYDETEQELANIISRLSKVTVRTVDRVKTVLRTKHDRVNLPHSVVTKPCHAETCSAPGESKWNIYIETGSLNVDHLIPVVKVLHQILGRELHDTILNILPLLTCSEAEIPHKLQALNVDLGSLQKSIKKSVLLPSPGTEVKQSLKRKLDVNCSDVEVNEFVAYQPHARAPYVHAIIKGIENEHGQKRYRLDVGHCHHVDVRGGRFHPFKKPLQ